MRNFSVVYPKERFHSRLVASFLQFANEDVSRAVAVGCARRGLLFKRTAYNFVSLAHDEAVIDRTLEILGDPDLMSSLRQSIKEIQEGKTEEWDTVKAELGL